MRPLYLIVGFWGDRFRSYFIDYCLPSLLSPRNLGILSAGDGHRFLICTTAADWLALQRSSSWNLLLTHATPVHIEVGFPDDSSEESKFRHMTYGHRLLVNEAYRDRALACQIMPDAMYTDGTIETVLRHAAEGAHAVLTVALRLKEEGLLVGLHNQKLAPEYVSAQSVGTRLYSSPNQSSILSLRTYTMTACCTIGTDRIFRDGRRTVFGGCRAKPAS